jgi:serine/threonine protein phosphatase 1
MMRTIVIGDIHGGYRALEQLIDRIELRESDRLVFLGDYVDGWSQGYETVEWLKEFLLSRKQKGEIPILIKGNHDELFLDHLQHETLNQMWVNSGGQSTIDSYSNQPREKVEAHKEFLRDELCDYFIDEKNRLFIHAGFTNQNGPQYEYFKETPYWDRTLWEMAVALDPNLPEEDVKYPNRLQLFKEIYLGHTPVHKINEANPVKAANVWNLDTSAAYQGKLSAMDVDTKQVWQSDPVHKLYPREQGRN